jgi:hypothetical protein
MLHSPQNAQRALRPGRAEYLQEGNKKFKACSGCELLKFMTDPQSPQQAHPSTILPVSSSDKTKPVALTYDRLLIELPSLPSALRDLVVTILSGTDSMDPSHIDMLGRMDGIRWWKVNADGSRCLYYECYEICRINPEYYNSAPDDVRAIVDALVASDHTTQRLAAQVSLAKATTEDRADRVRVVYGSIPALDFRYLTSEASESVTQMAAFVDYRDHLAPIDTTELYSQTMLQQGSTAFNPEGKRKRASETDAGVISGKQNMAINKTVLENHDPYQEEEELDRAAKCAKVETSPKAKGPTAAPKQRAICSLAPGKKYYHWTDARLRVWRDLKGFTDQELPSTALSGVLHELESACTPPTVDIRLCKFDMSIEEIFTVSIRTRYFLP